MFIELVDGVTAAPIYASHPLLCNTTGYRVPTNNMDVAS